MLPDIQPGNTKILYFFNCLLDGMHTIGSLPGRLSLNELNSNSKCQVKRKNLYFLSRISNVFL